MQALPPWLVVGVSVALVLGAVVWVAWRAFGARGTGSRPDVER